MTLEKLVKYGFCFWSVILVLWIAALGGATYAIYHFIAKYW